MSYSAEKNRSSVKIFTNIFHSLLPENVMLFVTGTYSVVYNDDKYDHEENVVNFTDLREETKREREREVHSCKIYGENMKSLAIAVVCLELGSFSDCALLTVDTTQKLRKKLLKKRKEFLTLISNSIKPSKYFFHSSFLHRVLELVVEVNECKIRGSFKAIEGFLV
jgi:hypothetical protein